MGKKARKEKSIHNIENATKSSQLMKLNYFIANKYVTGVITIIMDVALFFMANYITNVAIQFLKSLKKVQKKGDFQNLFDFDYGFQNAIAFHDDKTVYIIILILILFIDVKFIYRIQTAYRNINKHQKGSSRWTSMEEIQTQYREIPDKGKTVTDYYKGKGGIPICHYENKFFIDDSPVNNLIIGITRSGKGQMFVFPLIDIYTRAENKSSMIINDPKLELASASYDTLIARGYEVHIFNLIEPTNGMGYNPLTLIVDAYKNKEYSTAEMLCSTFSYSIFNSVDSNNGENQFFYDNATFLLAAMILAHMDDCLKADEEVNKERRINHERERKAFHDLPEEEKGEKEKLLNDLTKLKVLLKQEKIKLLERTTIEKEIEELEEKTKGYTNQPFVPTRENEMKINVYSIVNTFSELARVQVDETTTMLDYYFNMRPPLDRAKLLYSSVEVSGGQKVKGSIFSTMLTSLMIFTYEEIAKMTAESTVNLESIGFGEKPVAIFLGIPDYDHSKDFLASVFIRQIYFVLAKKSSLVQSGKCDREVIFLLDEFGNMPAIEGMANIVTVCLGRNMRFNLVIQAYSQVEKLYGDDAETIIGNCGNQIYIQSGDGNTTDQFSKLIGSETITNVNRMGEKMSLKKSFTEITEEKPLINSNELQELMEGENVIKRVMKRTDLKGRDVKPRPIHNHGETKFPYIYMYLNEYFPTDKTVSDVTKETREHINHRERVFDVIAYMDEIENRAEAGSGENELFKNQKFAESRDIVLSTLDKSFYLEWHKKYLDIFQTELEDFKNCTIGNIYDFLLIQKPLLANKWKTNVLTAIESIYETTNEIKKDCKLLELNNANELVSFLNNNMDQMVLLEHDIYEEIDLLECSIKEVREYLPEDKRGYYDTLTERGFENV